MLHAVSNAQPAVRCCGSTKALMRTTANMQHNCSVGSHACCTSLGRQRLHPTSPLLAPSRTFRSRRPTSVYAAVKAPKQKSNAHSQGHRKNGINIGSAFSSMMKRTQDQHKQQEQLQSEPGVDLTQMAIVLGAGLIAPGWRAMGSYLSGIVFWPYLAFIADAKGELDASDLAFAKILQYGSMAAVGTALVALLCHLQGSSLKQLMRLDFSNPGQVVGRAGLTAAAALAVDAVLWTYLDVLSGLKTTPLYIYMHSGDVLAIALHSAPALILAPVFEELVFRGFFLQTMVTFAPRLTPLHLLVSSLQFASVHQANAGSLLGIGVTGLCLGTSYLASGRNLLVPIIAHALFNLAAAVYVAMQP